LKNAFHLTIGKDLINAQVRHLRPLLVKDTTAFEQSKVIVARTSWNAQTWLNVTGHTGSCLSRIVHAIVELATIDKVREYWPTNLTYDFSRLMVLNMDFRIALFRQACFQMFDAILDAQNAQRDRSFNLYRRLWKRLEVVSQLRVSGYSLSVDVSAAALEIIHEACRLSGDSDTSNALWHRATRFLYACMEPHRPEWRRLSDNIRQRLADDSDREAQIIAHFTPLELLGYVTDVLQNAEGTSQMAKRLAHISVLHWRVWGAFYKPE
jgi:hypothetical protein